jgi:hypothetical protein
LKKGEKDHPCPSLKKGGEFLGSVLGIEENNR